MTTRRVAIIGCGGRAHAHARPYRSLQDAELVACASLDSEEHRADFARQYNIAPYLDAGEMIRREKPDLVHIVTWPDVRVPLMTLVSDLGVPACTVEKPIATGVGDYQALCRLAEHTETRFAVCHQFRWHRDLVRCREAIESGRLGRVLFLDGSAGFNISGQGTHVLNYLAALNGNSPITQVFGSASGASQMRTPHPGPDMTEAHLKFANGAEGLWVCGDTARRCGDPTISWQHVRIAAYAERGRVLYEEFGRWEIVSPEGIEAGDLGDMDAWASANLEAQADFHRAMLAWIDDENARPGTHLEQALHEWNAILALYASALERRPVDVPFGPPADLPERLTLELEREAVRDRDAS